MTGRAFYGQTKVSRAGETVQNDHCDPYLHELLEEESVSTLTSQGAEAFGCKGCSDDVLEKRKGLA